jgi:hypothetical protein
MCKSQNEGGQRCAGHTRPIMEAAIEAYRQTPTLDAHDAVQRARADFASTPTGRSEFEARMEELPPNAPERVELAYALQRGHLIRERNQGVAEVLRSVQKNPGQVVLTKRPKRVIPITPQPEGRSIGGGYVRVPMPVYHGS